MQPPLRLDIVRIAREPERLLCIGGQAVQRLQARRVSVHRGRGGGAGGGDHPPPRGPDLRGGRGVGALGRGKSRWLGRPQGACACGFSLVVLLLVNFIYVSACRTTQLVAS